MPDGIIRSAGATLNFDTPTGDLRKGEYAWKANSHPLEPKVWTRLGPANNSNVIAVRSDTLNLAAMTEVQILPGARYFVEIVMPESTNRIFRREITKEEYDGPIHLLRRSFTTRQLRSIVRDDGIDPIKRDFQPDAPLSTHGSIAHEGTPTSANNTAQTSLTVSHTIGSGSNRLAIFGTGMEEGGADPLSDWSSATYNGTGMTEDAGADIQPGATVNRSAIWSLGQSGLPTTGTHNVVINVTNAAEELTAGVTTYTGAVDQTAEANTNATGENTSQLNPSITTVTANAMIVGASSTGGNNAHTFTAVADETIRVTRGDTSASFCLSEEILVAAAGSHAHGVNAANSQNRFVLAVAAYEEVAAGGVAGIRNPLGGPLSIRNPMGAL